MFNWNFLHSNLCPLPLVLSLDTNMAVSSNITPDTHMYLYTLIRSP